MVLVNGHVEPERISVIVSDTSGQSGYLDVQFDVPSGGSFRVMDVIVAEAPRFADTATNTDWHRQIQVCLSHKERSS